MQAATTAQTPATTPHDANQAYELVSNLIFDQVHKFFRRFGGDFDELVGEANLAFVTGHRQYIDGVRPNGEQITHPFAVEIRRWVWFELFDAMRSRLRRENNAKMLSMESMELDVPAKNSTKFKVKEWVAGLGEDAQYAVELVLYPPEEVETTAEARGGTPRNYRSTVRAYLTAEGWKPARINKAFDEIKEALG